MNGLARLLVAILLLAGTACAGDDARVPDSTPIEPTPAADAPARDLVAGFMQARLDGDAEAAESHLGPQAVDAYAQEGLTLLHEDADRWEFVSVEAADASSYEVIVRIYEADAPRVEEVLFVGPGPDHTGAQQPWIIRGAMRLDGQE